MLRATDGGVIERCLTGVLVLLLTGEGDAVRETTGDNCVVVGAQKDDAPYVL